MLLINIINIINQLLIFQISTLLDSKEVTIERKLSSLKCLIPEVDWVNIIKQIAINHDADFDLIHDSNVILDVNYLIKISQLIKKTKPRVLANYFGWRTAETIGFLAGGQDFLLIQNEFHERQWNAQSKLLWKQCLKPLQYHGAMGIGRKYLQRYLPKQHRDQVIQIADSVQKSFAHSVENNDWLPENKKEFVKRIKNIHFNIGYPEWILEQEKLDNFYKKFVSFKLVINNFTINNFVINNFAINNFVINNFAINNFIKHSFSDGSWC